VKAEAKRVQSVPVSKPVDTLAGTALPAVSSTRLATESEPGESGVVVLIAALSALGLLMLGAAAVPPARVPWPELARPLYVHRSNLTAFGIGTIMLALLFLNIAVLF
jgi:hypothetical protein